MSSSKYDPKYCDLALQLLPEGLTDEEFSECIGVSRATLFNWAKRYPEFKEAMRQGKRPANKLVEAAVLRNAIGYDYEEKEYGLCEVMVKDRKTGELKPSKRMRLIRKIVKHHPGNPTDRKFYLINRDPERWKDKQDHDHSVSVTLTHEQALSELE